MEKFNPENTPYMRKKEAKRRLEKTAGEIKENFAKAERGWEETGQELDFEKNLEERVKEGQEKEKDYQDNMERVKKLRKKVLFGEGGEEEKGAPGEAEDVKFGDLLEPEEEKPAEKSETAPEKVYELTNKKEKGAEYNPKNLSLDELDDRVHEMWKAMGEIIKHAGEWKPTKEEKKKLKKFSKKGGEWPLQDAVTAENYKEQLKNYGIAEYIDSSLIEKDRDVYAVVSKQYGIYRDELEKRIRKAKLAQLEEADGKARTKKEKEERKKEVEAEIVSELPPVAQSFEKTEPEESVMTDKEMAEREEEAKKLLGEDADRMEVGDEDIIESQDLELDDDLAAAIRKDIEGEPKIKTAVIKKPEKKKKTEKPEKKKGFFARLFGSK